MGSIKINNSNSYIVLKETGVVPFGNSPRTIECSFKMYGNNSSTCLFSYGSTSSGTPLIYVGFIDNKLYFEAGSGNYKFVSVTTYNDDEWHTLKFIVTGTQIKIYVDENKEFETNGIVETADSYFYIGCYGVSSAGDRYFNGYVDEVRIWNKALSEYEMFKTYNRILTGNEDGLVLNYSFKENDIINIVDKTGRHNGIGTNLEYSYDEGYVPQMFILKSNGKYYSVNKDCYNTTTKQYNEITNLDQETFLEYGFFDNDLFTEITIDGETFKPIDKFTSFSLVLNKNVESINMVGLKTNTELVITNNDSIISSHSNINSIINQSEMSNNGQIKMVFSIDEGNTWKSHDGIDFVNLSIIIPNKPYNEFTEDELIQWNNARDEIFTNGIDANLLNTLDFNVLDFNKIRFAYVLHTENITDTATNQKVILNFDSENSMILMKDNEIDIEVFSNRIRVVPKINSELIKLNIATNGIILSDGSGSVNNIELGTTNDINLFINSLIR